MSEIFKDIEGRVCRKKAYCCFCFEPIMPGEKYDYRTGTHCGDFFVMKMHPECNAYANEHLSAEDCEDLSEPAFDRPKPAVTAPSAAQGEKSDG